MLSEGDRGSLRAARALDRTAASSDHVWTRETRMAQGLAQVHQGDGRHPRSATVARPLMEGKRATVAPGGWLRDTLDMGQGPVYPLKTSRRLFFRVIRDRFVGRGVARTIFLITGYFRTPFA